MKKYIYQLIAFVFLFSACTAVDDLYDELDVSNPNIPVADLTYTLTEDDYDTADDACDCAGFGNFSSDADVKSAVPVVLTDLFPALGSGSSAIVTYDFFNGSSPDLRGTYYEVTVPTEDYDALGYRFPNFGNVDEDVAEWAAFKYPDAEDGDYADVTFDYWAPGVVTTTSRVVYTVAYGWQYAFILPDDAYGDFFGESGIDFSTRSEGLEKMPVYLNENNSLFVDAGTVIVAQYNHDDDNEGPTPDVGLYVFNGTEWLLYNDHYQVTAQTLSFGHDGTTWVPDNTVKYELLFGDYQEIGADYATSNPDGSASIIRFSNFDLGLWSSELIFEAITNHLLGLFPNAEEGQKYRVTYATWEPGAGSGEIFVILTDGVYVPVE